MTPPRLVCCYFGEGYQGQWPRLAHVLAYTADQQCAGWDVRIRTLEAEARPSATGVESHVHNTQKLEHWCREVEAAPDGTRMLLIDADTIILRPLDAVWDLAFDVAYTVRPALCRLPFNAGVVFLRVSPAVRAFMAAWRDANARMLGDRRLHHAWRATFGGINQASLGHTLASPVAADVDLVQLPCAEWNCEDASWMSFDPAVTRIVHIKSTLRRAIFKMARTPTWCAPLTKLWHGLERAAGQQENRSA